MPKKQITADELKSILELHLKWLNGAEDGVKADLRCSNLSYSNLRGSNLSYSNLSYSDLRGSNLRGSNLSYSDLSHSDLSYSDLRGSDLRGSNLDFSCLPLWCGSKGMKVSAKFVYQLLVHVCILECTDKPEEYAKIRELILPYAKQSHRANELGLLEELR